MLTGDVFNVSEGISIGFVDQVLSTEYADSSDNLRSCKAITGTSGDLLVAVFETVNHLIPLVDTSELDEEEWIVKWFTNGVDVC